MSLPQIVSAGRSPEELTKYSFQHARDHDDIDRALAQLGVVPFAVPLDPMPPLDNALTWLIQHQQKHNAMNNALGLTGDDLTKHDLNQPEELAAFVGTNYSEHDAVYQTLANTQGINVSG
jgi:hypothetical protein